MDKFSKIKDLGKGNMGVCALARNNEDGKFYAIKKVDLTRMNTKERQQSLNEARVLSSLRHPNIITYVDSFLARKSDHLCIVMEYADGGDLSLRIKKNYGVNFRETQVLDWFIQVVLSLHYIHQRKILHRDVKTQNIFLTSDGLVKLGDFGIARTLSSTYDQAKTFVGTPYYLSPELILERPYDHRSDVWAIGVVLYELLTLKHPFNGENMKGLMQRILKVQYDPIPMMYSAEMRNLVPRLLVKDPAKRIRLSDILELPLIHRRLTDWLTGEIVPKKYVDTLLSQNMLPESIVSLTKGLEAVPPPISIPALDSGRGSEMSLDTKRKKQLPPLQPAPHVDEPASAPAESTTATSGQEAGEPNSHRSASQSQIQIQSDSRKPSIASPLQKEPKETGSRKLSSVASPLKESKDGKEGLPGPESSGNNSVPTSSRTPRNPKVENPKPLRSPAMYRYYKTPMQLVSGRNQLQLNSDNPGPTRLNTQDNFYHQANYYQRAPNRELYRHYAQGQYLNPNLPALRRNFNAGRMENGQAAAHLHPLFQGNNNLHLAGAARDGHSGVRQLEGRNLLQRAPRRKLGTQKEIWKLKKTDGGELAWWWLIFIMIAVMYIYI